MNAKLAIILFILSGYKNFFLNHSGIVLGFILVLPLLILLVLWIHSVGIATDNVFISKKSTDKLSKKILYIKSVLYNKMKLLKKELDKRKFYYEDSRTHLFVFLALLIGIISGDFLKGLYKIIIYSVFIIVLLAFYIVYMINRRDLVKNL